MLACWRAFFHEDCLSSMFSSAHFKFDNCKYSLDLMKKFITVFLLVVTLIILLFNIEKINQHFRVIPSEIDIKKNISIIPLEDQEKLKAFFTILIKDHNFAYTLFGEKPCSIAGYMKASEFHDGLVPLTYFESSIFDEGWKSWCKYLHLFPSDNFVMKLIIYEGSPQYRSILIINKKAMLAVLKTHKKTIQKHLQVSLNENEILTKIIEDDKLWLSSSPTIEGILLGFGEPNSNLFEKCRELSLFINKNSYPPFKCHWNKLSELGLLFVQGYSSKELEPISDSFNNFTQTTSSIDELNNLTQTRQIFELRGSDQFLEDFHSPVFVIVPNSSETESLYKIYAENREKISKAYQGKPFIETTLNQWVKNN